MKGYANPINYISKYISKSLDLDDMGAALSRMYAYQYDLTRRK